MRKVALVGILALGCVGTFPWVAFSATPLILVADQQKPEPQKPDPPKPEPPKQEPPKQEPPHPAPEPAPQPRPPEQPRPETPAPKPENPKPDPAKQPTPPDPSRNEPAKPEPPKAEPPKTEPPKSEPPKTEPVKNEPKRNDPPKSDPPTKEPFRRPVGNDPAPTPKPTDPSSPKREPVSKPPTRDRISRSQPDNQPVETASPEKRPSMPSSKTDGMVRLGPPIVAHLPGSKLVEPITKVEKPVSVPKLPLHWTWQKRPPHHKKPQTQRPHRGMGIFGGLRFGFVTWNFLDGDSFDFSDYETDSADGGCAPSAFYYYPDEPPYISSDDVRPGTPAPELTGVLINPDDYTPEIKSVISALGGTWETMDDTEVAKLIPSDGEVSVGVEGAESYVLPALEFSKMFSDGVHHSRTLTYKVVEVDKLSDGNIEIHAEHRFLDAWTDPRTIDHAYILSLEAGSYVIREFRSSTYR